MKRIFLSGLLLVFIGISIKSQSLIPSGKYEMVRDKVGNGKVLSSDKSSTLQLQITCKAQDFAGNFIGIDNDSQFIGRAYKSTRNPNQILFRMTQIDDNFVAVLVGVMKSGIITGTWHSTAGHFGDFTLRRIE